MQQGTGQLAGRVSEGQVRATGQGQAEKNKNTAVQYRGQSGSGQV